MIPYCTTPLGRICPPRYLPISPSLKENLEKTQLTTLCIFIYGVLPTTLWNIHSFKVISRISPVHSAKWYVDEKSGSHTTFESLSKSFLSFFSYLYVMTPVWKFFLNSNKPPLSISLTIFMNGVNEEVFVRLILHLNND
jgi:hypothetical protein